MTDYNDYVLLTANAGVLINCCNKKILVDALHDEKSLLFSRVPDRVLHQVVNQENQFSDTDIVLVTHDHPDHYSRQWTQRLIDQYPEIRVVLPVPDFSDRTNVHTLSHDQETIDLPGVHIICKRLPHEGPEYESVINYGYLLDINGFGIVLLGDGRVDEKTVEAFMDGFIPDLALLNFPFLTLKRGRDIMERIIGAEQVIFYHLPEPGDDISGFTRAARQILATACLDHPNLYLLNQSMLKVPILAGNK